MMLDIVLGGCQQQFYEPVWHSEGGPVTFVVTADLQLVAYGLTCHHLLPRARAAELV